MIWIEPKYLKNGLIVFNFAVFLWELYLNLRQFRTVYKAEIPENFKRELDQNVLYNSRQYTSYKLILWFLKEVQRIVIVTWILYVQELIYFWENLMVYTSSELIISLIAFIIFITVPYLLDLPFTIFQDLFLEPKFGSSKQTFLSFLSRGIKSIITEKVYILVVFVIIFSAMAFTRNFAIEYYYTSILCISIVSLVFIVDLIYPSLVAPFFNKHSPLPEGDLKIHIENLCSQLEFPIKKIMVKHSSEKSHQGAYIDGMFSNKMILYNNILKYEDDIVLAIISHEIGHSKLKHSSKKNNVRLAYAILCLLFYFQFIDYYPLYRALGFFWWNPHIIGAFAIFHFIRSPCNTFYKLFLYRISRQVDMEADEFVMQNTTYDLKKTILKIWECDLTFPVMDTLYCKWFYDHIPILDRLSHIDTKIRKN